MHSVIVNRVRIFEHHNLVHILLDDHNNDTYLIWKPIMLVNFNYTAFVSKTKTVHLTKVCNLYKPIFAGIQKPIDKHTFHNNIVPRFDYLHGKILCFVILDTYSRRNSM